MTHTQMDSVHGEKIKHFGQRLIQKQYIRNSKSREKFYLEVSDPACRRPSGTLTVGMFTDGLDSAIVRSHKSSIRGCEN
jgi:hypothetical protein